MYVIFGVDTLKVSLIAADGGSLKGASTSLPQEFRSACSDQALNVSLRDHHSNWTQTQMLVLTVILLHRPLLSATFDVDASAEPLMS